MGAERPSRQVAVTFASNTVEADPRELLEHLDTPSLMKPFLEMPADEDRALYLQCVDELRESMEFLERIPQLECCVSELHEGRRVMDHAMTKVQADVLTQLASHCLKLQREPHLKQLAKKTLFGRQSVTETVDNGDSSGGGASGELKLASSLPELLPQSVVDTLAASVSTIVACGRKEDLVQGYLEQRQSWQEGVVRELGLRALLAEDVGSARWEKLEDMILIWNEQLRVLSSLAVMEDGLATQILKGVEESSRKQVVLKMATLWLKPLLAIGTAVADGKKSPERIVPFLDMTESLLEAQATFRQLSLVGPGSPASMVEGLLDSVRECVKATAEEFKRLIVEDDVAIDAQQQQLLAQQQQQQAEGPETTTGSTIPAAHSGSGKGHRRIRDFLGLKITKVAKEDSGELQREKEKPAAGAAVALPTSGADGDVQKITKYVSNFILFLMHKDLPYVVLLKSTLGSMEAVCEWLKGIMTALKTNLEIKAAALPGDQLPQLFLMNNKNYIIGKLDSEETAVKEMLGKKWAEDLKNQLEKHRDSYITFMLQTFEFILSSDRDRDPTLFVNRVNAFNAAFDELCQKQKMWRVPNADLCSLIKLEETNGIVGKYKEFLNSHRHFTQGSRVPKIRLLTIPEIEARIAESFPEKKK